MLNLPNVSRPQELPSIQYRQYSDQISYSCCGFLYVGPQNGVFYLTLFLICGTMGLFFGFDAPYLSKNVSIFIPLMAGFILLLVLSCLLRCAFMDPGIIPRSTSAEFSHLEKELNSQFPKNSDEPGSCASTSTLAAQKTKEICINGQIVVLKFCPTCRIYRPPRSSHCSICDSCILRFDHHCPWVGNCVGLRNYRYFYLFLVLLSLLCVYVFFCVVVHLVEISKRKSFAEAVQQSPASLIIGVICFFSVWSVLGLAGFHTYLVSSSQTTNEDIKGTFTKKSRRSTNESIPTVEPVSNPYRPGNLFRSCFIGLCEPEPPRQFKSQRFAMSTRNFDLDTYEQQASVNNVSKCADDFNSKSFIFPH